MRAEFQIPGEVPSSLNMGEHWRARVGRVKRQREQARLVAGVSVGLTLSADIQAFGGTVTITRVAPRSLDDDNLAGACKALRDGIALAMGVDDGDPRIAWRYAQARCRKGEQAVRVTVEAARPRPQAGG